MTWRRHFLNKNGVMFYMKSDKFKIIFSWALVLLWIAVVFLFSSQEVTQSSALSGNATSGIAGVLKFLTFGFYNIDTPEKTAVAEDIVRETAHVFEFLILGVFTINAFKKSGFSRHWLLINSMAFCIFNAFFDEFHQMFVAGRATQLVDLLLDSAGALIGILLMNLMFYLREKRYNRV